MNSWGNRLNSLTTYALTVIGVATIALAASSLFLTQPASSIQANIYNIQPVKVTTQMFTRNDLASFRFSFKADLRPVFHWNVKQVFIYITAHYESTNSKEGFKLNEEVIWDKIVQADDDHVLDLKNVNNKYPLIDFGNGLRGAKVTFKINWDITPYSGKIFSQTVPETANITLPQRYKTASQSEDFLTYDDLYPREFGSW